MKFIETLKTMGLTALTLVVVACGALMFTKCTYESKCANCHVTICGDIIVPTDPDIYEYKMCPECGKPLELEVHNNLNLLTKKEKWSWKE